MLVSRQAPMQGLHIPERCGVMLLPDCTLFPQGGLPLFIFEERYRIMLQEALEGNCFFAVCRRNADDQPAAVGTIGLVRASREQTDGTSQLLLHGIIRVRFTRWHEEKPYPFATIEPVMCRQLAEEQQEPAKRTLVGSVEDAIANLPEEARTGIMDMLARIDHPGMLTDVVSHQFVQEPDLRQKLLETEAVADRIPLLCAYLHRINLG